MKAGQNTKQKYIPMVSKSSITAPINSHLFIKVWVKMRSKTPNTASFTLTKQTYIEHMDHSTFNVSE